MPDRLVVIKVGAHIASNLDQQLCFMFCPMNQNKYDVYDVMQL